ncbi:MAG: SDR family oxidoreductase [Bacteroidetes bacterium]|nr:SDR family oxidoreductase [Bacteroidota bacterium]
MTIVITGASRGIGFELANLCIGHGHQVFCLTRHTDSLLQKQAPGLHVIKTDLADEKSIAVAVQQIQKAAGHIDVVVNNAGSLVNKPFAEITYAELEQVYKVNVFAPFKLVQLLRPMLGHTSHAHVVNISSIGGFQGSVKFPGLSAYSSSKAAIAGLTECMAEEFKEQNITVNCLALGAVQTEMLAEAFPGYEAPVTPLQMAEYIYEFARTGHKYYNGKILPVSLSTP